jgi:membrane-associated protease RseP (regulator of RpoE activity)
MEEQSLSSDQRRNERLQRAVRQVLQVQDVTVGTGQQGFAVRYRGRLIMDSESAYEQLQPVFQEQGMTLVFRQEDGEHVILAVPGLIEPTPSNPWVNAALFVFTLLSVLLAGALYGYDGPVDISFMDLMKGLLRELPNGLPFAASLLGILGAHEFGHYFAARYHNTAVTLPYFLPFPGSPFGTLGAFIQLKQPPRNRKVLLDIGLAGPLAGLVVAIPVLLFGLYLSDLGHLPTQGADAMGHGLEGNSLLYLAMKYAAKGKLLPQPVSYGGVEPWFYWVRYVFLGHPIPYGGLDVMLHPVAWAGWAGLLVTALNLIPAGQLDGGHTIFVLLGRRAVKLWPFIVVTLVALGLVWTGWFLWAALIFFLGRRYAQPLDEITQLDGKRKALAVVGMIVFFLVFTPVPLVAL